MLNEILEYFVDPLTLLTHLVGGGLIGSLPVQGTAVSRLWTSIVLAETVTALLYAFIPEGWWAIIAIAFWIHLYERIAGPRARVQKNAIFLAGKKFLIYSCIFFNI